MQKHFDSCRIEVGQGRVETTNEIRESSTEGPQSVSNTKIARKQDCSPLKPFRSLIYLDKSDVPFFKIILFSFFLVYSYYVLVTGRF